MYSLKIQATHSVLGNKLQWLFTKKAASVCKTTYAEVTSPETLLMATNVPTTALQLHDRKRKFAKSFSTALKDTPELRSPQERASREVIESTTPSIPRCPPPPSVHTPSATKRMSSSNGKASINRSKGPKFGRRKITCSLFARHTLASTLAGDSQLGGPPTDSEDAASGAGSSACAPGVIDQAHNAVETAQEMDAPSKPSRRTSAGFQPPSKRLRIKSKVYNTSATPRASAVNLVVLEIRTEIDAHTVVALHDIPC
jgi:hypothetical protein